MSQIITGWDKKPVIEGLAEKNRAGLKPWQRCNDAEAVPDRGFRKQLKCLDDSFEVVWNSASENWEIWSFPKNGIDPYLVMRVGKAGTYEELSQKVLLQMQENIYFANNCTAKQVCDYLEEYETQLRRKKEEAFSREIRARAVDTRAYVNNVLQIQVPRSVRLQKAVGA